MNILHLTPYHAPAWAYGGVPRAVEGLARAQQRRGHRVTVLTSDSLAAGQRHPGPADELCDGVRVLRVPNALPWLRDRFNLSTTLRMRTLARELLPEMDVVHCHELRTLENLLVTPQAQAPGLPLVLSPHGTLSHATGRGRFKALWDRVAGPTLARRFSHVIALTEAEVAELRALWPADTPVSIIPNGIDPEEFADLGDGATFRETWRTGAGPLCLFMGRLHERKGLQALVEAFRRTGRPDARLVIAGPDEGMRARLEALQDGRLLFTGPADRSGTPGRPGRSRPAGAARPRRRPAHGGAGSHGRRAAAGPGAGLQPAPGRDPRRGAGSAATARPAGAGA